MRTNRALLIMLVLMMLAVLTGGLAGFILYSFWDLPEVRALEEYKPSITTRVYSDDKQLLAEFYAENRTPVSLGEVPERFLQALIATEDRRFYQHHGIDVRGIARAMYRNIRAGSIQEGGSTLTQQLAKVLFLTPEKSYLRKLKEMALALRIEQRYTKREILTLYCNQIYFGNGAYGVAAAARIYFGKTTKDLDLAECALLAGLPRSPKRYSPFKAPALAAGRRAYVLNCMVAAGYLGRNEAEDAKRSPIPRPEFATARGPAPYFVEYVRQQVEDRFGSRILYSGGLNIYTSLNMELQKYAEQAVHSGLAKIEARRGGQHRPSQPLQAAFIALEPANGRIRAMVGGRDFAESQFNRACQAYRQPGSAFKPVVFAAALERGYGASDLLDDSPLEIALDRNKVWKPENFAKTYQGPVTLGRALSLSLNVPTVRLLQKIGIEETIRFARRIGIKSPLAPVPSLALGSSDLTLIELTASYAVFAGGGARIEPVAIIRITDAEGMPLAMNDGIPEQVMKPEIAYLVTDLLRGVIEHGTGWKARELGTPDAGKTGTTNDYRDAWFIGYTPGLVAGVWVGYDNQQSIGRKETGARAALPVWLEFMKKACAGRDAEEFTVPDGILFRQVDPVSGLLAAEECGNSVRQAYLAGTEPRRYCSERAAPAEELLFQDEAPQ